MHYVYVYIDPRNNLPFYVGKGQGKRAFVHLAISKKRSHNLYMWRIIQKLKALGMQPIISCAYSSNEQSKCFSAERLLIAMYGRKDKRSDGLLVNHTDGGEGRTHTEEEKEALRKLCGAASPSFGLKRSDETKKKLSDSHRGVKHPLERRLAQSRRKTGVKTGPLSKEHKTKISLALTGKKRGKYKPRTTPVSEEFRLKMSESTRNYWKRRKENVQ